MDIALEALRALPSDEQSEWRELHGQSEDEPLKFSWKYLLDWTPMQLSAVVVSIEQWLRSNSEATLPSAISELAKHHEALAIWYLCRLSLAVVPKLDPDYYRYLSRIHSLEKWLMAAEFPMWVRQLSGDPQGTLAFIRDSSVRNILGELGRVALCAEDIRFFMTEVIDAIVARRLSGPFPQSPADGLERFRIRLDELKVAVYSACRTLCIALHFIRERKQKYGLSPVASACDIVASSTREGLTMLRLPVQAIL